ncbi:hypothetical protein ABVT39_014416 [Epinephelus coioides]
MNAKEKNKTNNFVVGTNNFKVKTVKDHESARSDQESQRIKTAKTGRIEESLAGRTLPLLKTSELEEMQLLFRNAHAIGKKGRPFTNFAWIYFGDEEVNKLISHFRPLLLSAAVDVELIPDQWTILKTELYTAGFSQGTFEKTWPTVNRMLRHQCPDVLNLFGALLTIPATTADCERGFSVMKQIDHKDTARLRGKDPVNTSAAPEPIFTPSVLFSGHRTDCSCGQRTSIHLNGPSAWARTGKSHFLRDPRPTFKILTV